MARNDNLARLYYNVASRAWRKFLSAEAVLHDALKLDMNDNTHISDGISSGLTFDEAMEKQHGRQRADPASLSVPSGAEVLSINEFCASHRISRATFYNLVKAGQGPILMKVGTRSLISREAATDWRREREKANP